MKKLFLTKLFIALSLLWASAASAWTPAIPYISRDTFEVQFNGCLPGFCPGGIFGGGSGIPSWVVNPANPPDQAFDFTNNVAWSKTGGSTTASSLLTVSRASVGYVNDSSGNWTAVGPNLPRLSNLGLLVEETRTNSIRNNSDQGAVVMADGVELLTNPTFIGSGLVASGWTPVITGSGNINFTPSSGLQMTGDAGVLTTYVWQQISGLTVGRNYVISYPVGGNGTTVIASVGTSPGNGSVLARTNLQPNTVSGVTNPDRVAFTATATTLYLNLERTIATQANVAGFSVQDGERVQNGNFAFNPLNASQNTVQNGWQWSVAGGATTVTYTGGNSVTIVGDGTNIGRISQAVPTLVGCTYTLSVDIGTSLVSVAVGTAAYGSTILNVASGVGTGLKFQFTATGTTTYITFARSGAATSVISNVSTLSAGALPTNWVVSNSSGVPFQIPFVGTENGVDVFDFQLTGTPTVSGGIFLQSEPSVGIATTYGQTISVSGFQKLTAGATTNFSSTNLRLSGRTSGGSAVSGQVVSVPFAPTGTLTRTSGSVTFTDSTVAGALQDFQFVVTNGSPINGTFRIGWPQLENNNINSTVASAVKAADGTAGVDGTAVYTLTGGTGTQATLNVTWAGGVMTVNSVASAGSYTTLPPSPATLAYVSGVATGWTGATVTLTPTSNAASAFATSPIRTTNAAAVRNTDLASATFSGYTNAASVYGKGTPQAPLVQTNVAALAELNDGSGNNRLSIRSNLATAQPRGLSVSGGVNTTLSSAGALSPGVSAKLAVATAQNDQALLANGGAAVTSAAGNFPVGITTLNFGNTSSGAQPWNGFVEYVAPWTSRVPNAQLQSMTSP